MSDNEADSDCVSSKAFSAADADVTFRSSDNVLFRIYRRNLASGAGAFTLLDLETPDKIVPLTELSSTLEHLFQYLYPMPQPDITGFSFETVALLAEAAEKYKVFSAMYICKVKLQNFLPTHALHIFVYAGNYGYKDILDTVAPLLIVVPLEKMVLELPLHLVVPWVQYHTAWAGQLRKARSFPVKLLENLNLHTQFPGSRNGIILKLARFSARARWQESNFKTMARNFVGKFHFITSALPDISPRTAEGDVCHLLEIVSFVGRFEDIVFLQHLPELFKLDPDQEKLTALPAILRDWQATIERDLKDMKPFITYLGESS